MSRGGRPDVVVITGASAGIGRAVACEFARHGARIGLLARSRERLQAAAEEVRAFGGEALELVADVAHAAQVEAAAARVEEAFGPIDIWINSAMVTVFAPVHRVTPEEYRRVTEVTYLGTVHGTLAALARMRGRNRGTIVQVGSALAYRAIPLQSAYCAAKFAIRGFTDALRVELMHERCNIRLTMVQLSAFNTPQFDWARNKMQHRAQPVPPIFQPELAARGIRHAAYAGRREVCVGFPAVKAIWGNKFAPALADRVLSRQAWEGQITDDPLPPGPDNLFEPVEGEFGAHGRFDQQARGRSWQLWSTMHRAGLAVAALVVLVLLVGVAALVW
ncbi:SDR family oxidoreductase [Lysobacter sp. D1-1-M9]|uniref:SDR family oxidoreductase n=1 Tax=Novilysobacter longmucuonensis TaxID=3098603 RepID=UPI002FC979BB